MKGYKTANGGYITAKEIQQQRLKYKKELKEYRQQQQKEQERKEYYNNLLYLAEKKQQREEKEKLEKLIEDKKNFIDNIGQFNLPYKQFLIVWDIINNCFYQIESDYRKSKIIKDDIVKVLEIIPNILITEYNKGLLLSL